METDFSKLKVGDWVMLGKQSDDDFVLSGRVTTADRTLDWDYGVKVNYLPFMFTAEDDYYIVRSSRPEPVPVVGLPLKFHRESVEAWVYGTFKDGHFVGTEVPTTYTVTLDLIEDVVWEYL